MRDVFAALIALTLCACACAAGTEPPRPSAGDCVEIGVESNGFHTSLIVPGEALGPDHPLRRLFPEANWLVVGWGDEDFFREPGGGTFEQGCRAVLPGGSTVVHAIGLDIAPEEYFVSVDTSRTVVTRAGAAQLARFLAQEIVQGPDGDAVVVGPGQHAGRSYFLRGRKETFSLFNNCNHWTARGLRAAGVRVPGKLTANSIMDQVEKVEATCPAPAVVR